MGNIKETKVYNINDFLNWYERDELDISPKYQRNPVWNMKAKSYLIDTIIRGLPIPQILIRQTIDTTTRTTNREVIDGQQRLRAIIEFINNEFIIAKSHNKEFGNLRYSDLEENIKEDILSYELPVEMIKVRDDNLIYSIFARLNTNSVTLNKQEVRNAKFWGEFKVFIYNLSEIWRKFFIEINMFTDKQLSRMLDIEFLSSLIIVTIDGIISETSTIIDSYYKKYDTVFEDSDEIELKFTTTMKLLVNIFENKNFTTNYFHRKNYFYTLFCVLFDQIYGIPNVKGSRNDEYNINNITANIEKLISALIEFETNYEKFMSEELFDDKILSEMIKFKQHHRTRTTNSSERIDRIKILKNFITSRR